MRQVPAYDQLMVPLFIALRVFVPLRENELIGPSDGVELAAGPDSTEESSPPTR